MLSFTANLFSLLAVSGKTRANDCSLGSSGENMSQLAVKVMTTAVQIVLFRWRYFAGEISILSSFLLLTASGLYFITKFSNIEWTKHFPFHYNKFVHINITSTLCHFFLVARGNFGPEETWKRRTCSNLWAIDGYKVTVHCLTRPSSNNKNDRMLNNRNIYIFEIELAFI